MSLEDDLRKFLGAGAAVLGGLEQLDQAGESILGRAGVVVDHLASPETLQRALAAGVAAAGSKLAEEALEAANRTPRARQPERAAAPAQPVTCGKVCETGPYAGAVCDLAPHGPEIEHSAPVRRQPAPPAPPGSAALARPTPPPRPMSTRCDRHREQPWHGTIVCTSCSRVYQVTDERAARFAPDRCACGAQLLPAPLGERPHPIASRVCCALCFTAACEVGGFLRG
jgi:uncharacterized protein YbaR (Trm112 family)